MTMSESQILANLSKRKNPAKPRRQTDKVRMSASDGYCWPNLGTSVEITSGVIGSFFVVAHANFLLIPARTCSYQWVSRSILYCCNLINPRQCAYNFNNGSTSLGSLNQKI